MDLVGAIINHFNSDTSDTTNQLQSLMSGGSGMWGYFMTNPPRGQATYPYIIVSDLSFQKIAEGARLSYRIDYQIIQFEVYSNSMATTDKILTALEVCYLNLPVGELHVDSYKVLGFPFVHDRMKFRELDNWRGILNLGYPLVKSPQGS